MEIVVLPEIERCLFPLRPEEREALRASIEKEGVRDPLVVWPRDGRLVLVDGHHRYRIARELELEFRVVERRFADLEEVLDWIDRNQIARRNLTDEQRAVVLGRMYERQKKAAHRPKLEEEKEDNLASFSGHNATAKAIAATAGVNEKTVRRAAEFAKAVEHLEKVSPEAAKVVLEGKTRDAIMALPKTVKEDPDVLAEVAKEIVMSAEEEAAKKNPKKVAIKEVIREVKRRKQAGQSSGEARAGTAELLPAGPRGAAEDEARGSVLFDGCTLFCCDVKDLAHYVGPGAADVIITDPPYAREYLPVYEELGKLAVHALKPGGSLFVMTGQFCLPEVFQILSRHLSYHWTLAYLTPGGQSPQIWPRRVNTFWKPVLWFTKGSYDGPWVGDVVKSNVNDNDKRFHKWGQSVSGMLDLVQRVTGPGETVLDPFMGAGTTGVAALLLGRRFIGADIDQEAVNTAGFRLKEVRDAAAAGEAGTDRLAR
ncbi:MAG: DNA methyltransferase [Moorellales bacterium]